MRGPAPKEMGTKAGHSGKNAPYRVVGLPQASQPELPPFFKWYDGETTRKIKYPKETIAWWEQWGRSPLIDGFTEHDWEYLLQISIIHAKFYLGIDFAKMEAALRQRLAKFGVTPEDRAKLRIVTVTAETAEETAEEARRLNAQVGIVGDGRRLTSIPGFAS